MQVTSKLQAMFWNTKSSSSEGVHCLHAHVCVAVLSGTHCLLEVQASLYLCAALLQRAS